MLPTCYSFFNVLTTAFGRTWSYPVRSTSYFSVRNTPYSAKLSFIKTATRLTAGSLNKLPTGFAYNLSFRRQIYQSSLHNNRRLSGDEGIRTPGLRLAKAALSQLSYIPSLFRSRWAFQGSNLRPRPYQRRALTS
jgi:hypothetical protein